MFRKILIANRGEIACRVIRTARRLGIATVAVYSAADTDALHVRLADEAVAIGPAAAAESYLVGERILAAARTTGAEAIHPGYGFLSENHRFAEDCEAAGVVFIGPPASAIRAMGSKAAAKALMELAGVPMTPGYHGDDQDASFLAAQAERIGYPVLIKASAGGGGKGMRRVDVAADFAAALASCQREARNAFGDDRMLIERYVLQPRHIEIQVFGDQHGNLVHLFERDCSVQRRHQKVIEEAPAPGMTPERRAAMGRAAVAAARAVGYVGAGTVEFISAPDGGFYFMEMNTRLQVEHPVTEMITGLDLVEWQLRVAAGEPLPATQEQLRFDGHAIEARLYAEDPDKGFLPAIGRIRHLRLPRSEDGVRIDSGVEAGDEITAWYDPMIAKLIVHGRDRTQALARMRQALGEIQIAGLPCNVGFLGRLVTSPAFRSADLDTGLIERESPRLFPGSPIPAVVWQVAALAELQRDRSQREALGTSPGDAGSPWAQADGWRLHGPASRTFILLAGDTEQAVQIRGEGNGYQIQLGTAAPGIAEGSGTTQATILHGTATALRLELGGRRVQATVIAHGLRREVFVDGGSWALTVPDNRHADGADDVAGGLRAPMPGKVIALLVDTGVIVDKGTPLIVLEAMKMEHTILAPRSGKVSRFRFDTGEQVAEGADLLDFEDAEA